MIGIQQNGLLIKVANVEDEATGDASELYDFKKVGGKRGRVMIDRETATYAKAVRKILLKKNAVPEATSLDIVEAAISTKPKKRSVMVRQLGWRANKESFVTANGTIGARQTLRLLPPSSLNDKQHLSIGKRGSLKSWYYSVALKSVRSDVALLAISASFAAPILDFVGMQSFGINIFGESKFGKTTALLAAASVLGIGNEELLPNWSGTRSAREESAPWFNDLLFPMNEVGGLEGKKRDAYTAIREFTYRTCEGRAPAKNSKSTFATPIQSAKHRTIFLSTSEHSFNWYAIAAGTTRDEGEFARCMDVPATVSGCPSIMNRSPHYLSGSMTRRRDWSRNAVVELRNACGENYGYALSAYVEFLIENKAQVRSHAEGYMAEFLQDPRMAQLVPALAHAAKNFALIYAGGRLAMDADLLPKRQAQLKNAIVNRFERAMAEVGKRKTDEEIIHGALMANLPSAVSWNHGDAALSPKDVCGYYKEVSGRRRYVIHAEAFRAWFGQDRKLVNAALRWLAGEKLLQGRATTKVLPEESIEWAVTTPKWPNGRSVRSIVFNDPFAAGE